MSKIYNVVSLAVFLFVVLITNAYAQAPVPAVTTQQATVLANVNVYEPVVVSQENGVLTVGFDIANNADIAQGDINYGLDIIKKGEKGQVIVDSYVSPEPIALAAQASVHKEIAYTIPTYLSGEYEVWVVSRSTSGMMFGLGRAGIVTFENTAPYVDILPDTCIITVSGESTTYALYQGVDVSPEEVLSFSCTVESHFDSDITVTPAFSTHKRTRFGDVVETVPSTPESITLAAGEKRVVTLTIPKAVTPQAYDVRVSLVDAGQKLVSNEVIGHYVLRGASATIQTATLDKTAYAQGETLNALIRWTPSADSFPGARGEATVLTGTTLTLDVRDTSGVACISPITQPLTTQELTLTAPVTTNCASPTMAITITDDKGNVLDTRTIEAPEAPAVQQIMMDEKTEPVGFMSIETLILLITTVSSLMILYVLMTMRAVMRGDMVLKK